jgi:Polymerase A arginine-rich C-terminus
MAPKEAAAWWTRVQEASPEERERIADKLEQHASQRGEGGGGGGRPRRRRRRRRPAGGE